MAETVKPGDCVRVPDGRIGRVRDEHGGRWRVRVRRKTSKSHQFLMYAPGELDLVACPKGWMSPAGYERYLSETLAKLRAREAARHEAGPQAVR